MAPKKFTYTPGTGGGKQTKAMSAKGAASKKDKAALEAWAKSQQARGVFGPVTGTGAPSSKPAQFNLNSAGMGKRSPISKQVKGTVNTLNEITGVAPAQRIAQGKGSKTDVAMTAMSVAPVGKGLGLLAKGGKAAVSGLRGAEAVAATAKVGTKAFGKTKGAAAIKKASAAGRQSVIAKRTESDAATIRRGTQTSKTQEMAQKLEQQAAKENASKSVFEGPESTVKPLSPAPAGAKMPTGMTKAEIKKFGEKRSKELGSSGKQGRTVSQRAQVAKDIEETIKSQLAARNTGARAGAEIPGELGARRVGGPAADAATAAPAKAKPAPKPGPKQALRENAQLTAEPTGKPKVPSARASQAVKDKYAADLAAYNKQQATFEKQQAAIAKKTTDIEMGKAKAPSAKETGSPLVKTGPAKAVKKPTATKPKPAKPAAEAKPAAAPAKPKAPAAKPAATKPEVTTPKATSAKKPAASKPATPAEPAPAKAPKAKKPKAPTAAELAAGMFKGKAGVRKPTSRFGKAVQKFKQNKAVKATTAAAGTVAGVSGTAGLIAGPTAKPTSGKTYQAGNGAGMFSIASRNKARAEQAAKQETAAPKKKFGVAGESKIVKGHSAVRQSTIDQIKKQGMTKSLAAVKSRKNDPEYIEAIRRFYGAKRLKEALKG